MTVPPQPGITELLQKWQDGENDAMERLMPMVYEELRHIARRHMRGERVSHTLSTTGLVNETYLSLIEQSKLTLENRLHFYAIASRVMRRVLIWYARRRNALKRGGGKSAIHLDDVELASEGRSEQLIELDHALKQLERLDERLCRVVECRYFAGMTVDETAAILDVSPATVKRDWQTAKAWLHKAVQG